MVRYTSEQKADALKMLSEVGAKKTQENLGISLQTIYKWKNEATNADGGSAKRSAKKKKIVSTKASIKALIASDDGSLASFEALRAENNRLTSENNTLRVTNQKLKKALAALTEE